ncbi:MAG: DUF3540 domain-containing protein [Variovorax sp.]|nr:MAG: DUF3540 domain-containing protein [Variovorax sp.]
MSKREDPLLHLCGQPLQCAGAVRSVDEATRICTVDTAQGPVCARQAASCLLAPQAGDRVWLAGDLTQGLYVTAILERDPGGQPARVCLPAGASLEAPGGALTVRADSLRLMSRQLSVQAESAALCTQKFTGVGREATWSFGRIKVIGDLLESFADRVVQFSRWSQRTVDGMDQVRSKQIDYRADQSMQLQAANLIANADNLVKFDGEQIHLG